MFVFRGYCLHQVPIVFVFSMLSKAEKVCMYTLYFTSYISKGFYYEISMYDFLEQFPSREIHCFFSPKKFSFIFWKRWNWYVSILNAHHTCMQVIFIILIRQSCSMQWIWPPQVFPKLLEKEKRFLNEILAIPRLWHETIGQLSRFIKHP